MDAASARGELCARVKTRRAIQARPRAHAAEHRAYNIVSSCDKKTKRQNNGWRRTRQYVCATTCMYNVAIIHVDRAHLFSAPLIYSHIYASQRTYGGRSAHEWMLRQREVSSAREWKLAEQSRHAHALMLLIIVPITWVNSSIYWRHHPNILLIELLRTMHTTPNIPLIRLNPPQCYELQWHLCSVYTCH